MADSKINWELGPKAQWRDITGGQPTKFSIFHSSDQKMLTIEPPKGENYKPLTIQSDGTVDAGKFTGDGSDLKVGAGLSVKDALDQKAALNGSPGQDFQTKDLTVANALSFGSTVRQMINLWNKNYGIGIQNMTQYFRTDKNFAWYKGGSHNGGELNAGKGTVQMVIKDVNVGIGTSDPKAKLEISEPSEGIALNIGRKSGQPSIKGLGDWLILDAPKNGRLGLNYWEKGNVIIANGGGNVGIGQIDPGEHKLYVNGSTYMNGDVYAKGRLLYFWGPDKRWKHISNRAGNWAGSYNYSDIRLKTAFRPMRFALDKVKKLCGVRYNWSKRGLQFFTKDIEINISAGPGATADENQKLWQAEKKKMYEKLSDIEAGLIAQDVEKVVPEAVITHEDGYKGIKYEHIIALLVEAIKEQHEHLQACYAKITKLEKFIRSIPQNVSIA